jgi:hypothetical protein
MMQHLGVTVGGGYSGCWVAMLQRCRRDSCSGGYSRTVGSILEWKGRSGNSSRFMVPTSMRRIVFDIGRHRRRNDIGGSGIAFSGTISDTEW